MGPSAMQMVFLFVFVVVNSVMLFALGILLVRDVWCLGGNVTTIEGWVSVFLRRTVSPARHDHVSETQSRDCCRSGLSSE